MDTIEQLAEGFEGQVPLRKRGQLAEEVLRQDSYVCFGESCRLEEVDDPVRSNGS